MCRPATLTIQIACLTLAAGLIPQARAGDVVINGITFTDVSATGEVNLGFLPGSLAVLDINNDSHPDLAVGNRSSQLSRLFENRPLPGDPSRRTLVDVTNGSGFDDADNTARGGFGVVTGDYDNDGDDDIFLLGDQSSTNSHGLLYRNDGDGTFSNVSVEAGVRFTGYEPESASWVDFDVDGDLDLMVASGLPTIHHFLLLENEGDGTFRNAEERLPPATDFSHGHAYSHAWMDYDEDGFEDCFLIKSGSGIVLHNVDDGQGGRAFVNTAADIGFTGIGGGPMGISFGDYDDDDDLDIAITDFNAGTYFRNDGGDFTEVFPMTAVWGWGNGWIDVDNDGDLDYYMVGSAGNGSIYNKLWENQGASNFTEISDALNGPLASSRFSVQCDYDTDGRVDLFIINPANASLGITVERNESDAGNWLKVNLMGDGDQVNRSAIGSIVRLTVGGSTQLRHVASGTSTTATEDLRQHFGVGDATTIDSIEVIWPRAGTLETRTEVFSGPFAVNQVLTLIPGGSIPGDLTGDGCVDQADLGVLLAAYGISGDGDLDGDGDTDQADLGILLAHYGDGC